MKHELETKFKKGPNGNGGSNATGDASRTQAAPADNRTIAEKVKVAGDGTKMPPPTTVKEFMYDKVADKIYKAIGNLKPQFKNETLPKLSAEQEALHDVAAGMKKYQEYMAYAKTATAMLKLAPNNSAVKKALEKNLGNLNDLSKALDKAANTLGKIGKYANLAKDALGTANAVKDLIDSTPKDFSDRKAVAKFADSLKNASDNMQVWFDRGKDALLAAGKAGAGVAFSYFTGMISIGVDGVQAGVKVVNNYIDKMESRMKIIENGGIPPRELIPPDPPPPLKSYRMLQFEQQSKQRGQVYDAIDNQFAMAGDGIKRAFQERHREVGEKFDKDMVPKLYMQNREQFIKQLQREVKDPKMYERGSASIANSSSRLRMLEDHGPHPTPQQIHDEMESLRVHWGTPANKGTTIPLPYEKLLKQYRPELDKFYEKHGLGEGALEKEYIRHGLTQQAKDQLYRSALKELGLN